MQNKLILFFLINFFLSLNQVALAQPHNIKGRITEKFSGIPLSFAHVILNDNEAEFFADVDGCFNISHSKEIRKIKFKHHQYRTLLYDVQKNQDSLKVELQRYSILYFEEKSELHADRIIYNVLLKKKLNDTETHTPHSFTTYNKLIINTNKLFETKKMLEQNLKLLGIKLKPFHKDHNLFMIESVTQKKYLNEFNQREDIIASKVSGVDETSIYTISSLLLPGSIYKNYISLATIEYLSPLNEKTFSNYYFKVVDTALVNNETTYILKFTPARKNTDTMKGLIFINTASNAVTHFIISPAYDSPPFEIAQSFKKHQGKWFPDITRTNYLLKNYGRDNIRINLVAKTYRSGLKFHDDVDFRDFDDVVLKYNKSANVSNESYWHEVRREAFSEKDVNTYSFFDTIGSIKRFEKYSRLGEGIYNGIIPIQMVNLEVDKVLSANEYEGLRLGVGAHSNNLLSSRYSIGGYIGYGTRDGKLKYGINSKLIVDKQTEFTLYSTYYRDLREAAGVSFSFDRNQFSTENLRKIRLIMLDQVSVANYEASIKPIRYLYFTTSLSLESIKPTYNYRYKESSTNEFSFAEYKLGVKIAFGEKFIQSPQNKFNIPSKYPLFWLEFKRGLDDWAYGEFDYKKLDMKIQYTLKKPGFGTQTIQITGGIADGDLPYFKLYNMEGSWRTFSVVVHNSFESMRYNEFLSDRFIAIHFSQDLGRKLLLERPRIAPGMEILHNFGIGSLKNKEDHQDFIFKTMEKGYFESGIFIYDLITIRALGIKTGLGTGVFARYGPYSRSNLIDNFVYKLGLSFNL